MSILKHLVLWIVVIGLLGFAIFSFGFAVLNDDLAQIATNNDEYTTTPKEFKAIANAYSRNSTIAFLFAISLPVISGIYRRKNKS